MHLLSVFSLRNRALIALLTIVIGIFGMIGLTSLKQELFPSITLPQVIVTASYPGASPAVVENDVATPIESAIQGIEGLNGTSVTSGSGIAMVSASFDYGTDLIYAEQKIQLAMNALGQQLPEGVTPQVTTFSIGDFPIIQLAVTSEVDPNVLTDRLENLVVPELQNLPGVREATVTGGSGQRVVITPDKDELEGNNLSSQAIVDALGSAGILLAVGEIVEDGRELTVQAGEQLESVDDLAALPVLGGFTTSEELIPGVGPVVTREPVDLRIDDVAELRLTDNPVDSISRVDGMPALTLAITKTPAGNTVDVSHAVRDALPALAALVGDGTDFTVVFDQAPAVESSIEALTTEGLLGLAFAILVILVFLFSIRSTLVTAISIPASILVTFIGMWATGYSMNMLTLGAITISIGRVVDDSIVVIENIKHHLAFTDDKLAAIKTAVREVATAITSATITTVAVFLPIALVSDITGELFRPFALTVTIALLASLFVSLTIVPVLAYWFLGKPVGRRARARQEELRAAMAAGEDVGERPTRLQKSYLPIIRWTLKHPWVTLLAAVAVLAGTGYAAQFMQTNFVGQSPQNSITVTQKVDTAADLATKDAAATIVEDALRAVPGVEVVQLSVGSASPLAAIFGSDVDATFSITTSSTGEAPEIEAAVRDAIEGLDEAEVGEVLLASSGGGFVSNDILIAITGPDEETLREAADRVLDAVGDLDITAQASSNLAASRPFVSVVVDRAEAAEHQLSEVMVGRIASQAMNPNSSARFEMDGRSINVYLADADRPGTLEELRGFEFRAPDGEMVVLGDVASVDIVDGPTAITTQRGVRTAEVVVTPSTVDIGSAGTEVTAAVDAIELPTGTTAAVGGVVADQQDAFEQLGLALLAAILIVYTIMVATFRSLRQPLLLLVSIPFAATGAILLQIVSGVPLGAASLIGALMLVGIVVTNAIVLVDLVNQYRARGVRVREAVERGAARRLRPILMTSFATIFALLPMGLGITGQSGFISQPLAIMVIGGLVSSTLLTLVVLPTLYYLVEGAKERRADRRIVRAAREREDAGPSVADRLAGRAGPGSGSPEAPAGPAGSAQE